MTERVSMEDEMWLFGFGFVVGALIFGLVGGCIWDENTVSYETALTQRFERADKFYECRAVAETKTLEVK